MNSEDTAKWFAVVTGFALVAVGLLGFFDNPIVGDAKNDPLFVTGTVHNLVHVATGAIALWIGYRLTGVRQANGLIALGLAYAVVLVITLISPKALGLLNYPVNALDHVLHLVLAVAMIGVGWLARSEELLGRGI